MSERGGQEVDDEILRRHFVAIATSRYDSGLRDLPGVVEEVAAFESWLCNEALEDRRFEPKYPELRDNPTDGQIREALQNPAANLAWNESDAAVLVVTGHGTTNGTSHWLLLCNSDPQRLDATALRTADLLGWLRDTKINHLMVILDLCYAGQTTGALLDSEKDFPATWLILPSATRHQVARVGEFSRAVKEVLAELRGKVGEKYGTRYLRVEAFVTEINNRLGDQRVVPVEGSQIYGPHFCLPNPHYRPRPETAHLTADLEAHWGPRSRGATTSDEAVWLFSGRAELMQRLIAAAIGEPGTLMITGRAGSGKSAALARLVTLSDKAFCAQHAEHLHQIPDELRPPTGAVDVAVLATGKNAADIMTQLCHAVGAVAMTDEPPLKKSQTAWQKWITAPNRRPLTIVIDALDEASQPAQVVTEVLQNLQPAYAPPRVRLLVGVRTTGGRHGKQAEPPLLASHRTIADMIAEALAVTDNHRIAVDQPPWWVRSDVIEYVAGLLRAPEGSPYARDDQAVKDVAEALADSAGTSFLVAKLAAEELATRTTVIDADDPAWRASITNGVLGVFRTDLRRNFRPSERLRVVHLLRAVAFSFGRGLPWWNVWPRVANTIADDPLHPEWVRTYGDHDIAWLLRTRAGGYLVIDQEDDTTVYRLFHDDLSTMLRDQWLHLLTAPD